MSRQYRQDLHVHNFPALSPTVVVPTRTTDKITDLYRAWILTVHYGEITRTSSKSVD